MNEDELFQKISDRTYPGLLLVRQEVSVELHLMLKECFTNASDVY